MLAITTIIKSSDGSTSVRTDALLPLPPELSDPPRLESYLSITRPGWSQQDFGYWNYARLHENGDLYIYPGLQILGSPRPKKRFPGYSHCFTRTQIETYAEQVESISLGYQSQIADGFNLLVHDLRQLSNSIHHAAEEADFALLEQNYGQARIRIQNIIAMQSMLSIRTDLLDYAGSAQDYTEFEDVPIYKKVHKVVRSFQAYAADRRIVVHMEGTSFSRSSGPNVFEIVPYILIDNAIKYSPHGNDITVRVTDFDKQVHVTVSSVGPVIAADERKRIFEKGVRGAAAQKSGVPGSGAGLFIARRVVEQFGGKIWVETSNSEFIINGIKMTDVQFHVVLPSI